MQPPSVVATNSSASNRFTIDLYSSFPAFLKLLLPEQREPIPILPAWRVQTLITSWLHAGLEFLVKPYD